MIIHSCANTHSWVRRCLVTHGLFFNIQNAESSLQVPWWYGCHDPHYCMLILTQHLLRYCQSTSICCHQCSLVSTKCFYPCVLEFLVPNNYRQQLMEKLYFLRFLFLWFKWTTKSTKIRTPRLIMISQYAIAESW